MPACGTLNDLRLMPDCMLNRTTSPACEPTRPKLPHAVTHDTVALPSVAHVNLPARLFSTDQVRPSDSSAETETTSSQSREREVEYESEVMRGSLSDEGRTSRRVALRAIEPAWTVRCQGQNLRCVGQEEEDRDAPCESSNPRESRTTLVYRTERSAPAVKSDLPSSP